MAWWLWSQTVDWLAAQGVQPVLAWLHIANAAGDPREIAEAVRAGV